MSKKKEEKKLKYGEIKQGHFDYRKEAVQEYRALEKINLAPRGTTLDAPNIHFTNREEIDKRKGFKFEKPKSLFWK